MNDHAIHFKASIQKIAEYSEGMDLIHRTDWGEINFEDAEIDVSSVLHMAQDLVSLPVERLPDSVLVQGREASDSLARQLEQLDRFSLKAAGDINQRRNDVVRNIHNEADRFSREVGLWIPLLAYHRGDAEENIKKLNAAIASAE